MREGDYSRRVPSSHRRYNLSEYKVFVDNLPNSCGIPWFRLVFSQYGPIEDAFLPNRRSRRTGDKFGFVKFRERRGATLAVAKANGKRFGYRSLIVERTRYDGFSNQNRSHRSFSKDDREVGVGRMIIQRS
ncbi:hypothetical protein RHMOL_Rhmol06G0201200 [Rhododendron molle]|uniref:Uncharacterized protein n=1 Tax=Rhododendron molle TaxID=49168 RepID=A0ACC0NGM0_RHOML|nr:hypothetical protein RHMOL_Rhmol06G0201200 [Rhododendron molle]